MTQAISNKRERVIKLTSVLNARGFQAGVDDYRAGVWNADEWAAKGNSWNYERGRLWAAWCTDQHVARPKVKTGRKINYSALRLVSRSIADGSVL